MQKLRIKLQSVLKGFRMMVEKSEALEIAKRYYQENGSQEITKFYDAEKRCIEFGCRPVQVKIGNS